MRIGRWLGVVIAGVLATGGALVGTAASAHAAPVAARLSAAASPDFSICPPVDAATGCAVVVLINPNGTRTIVNNPGGTALGVYDASEDSMIGVQNLSSTPVSSVVLSSTTDGIFGFDGDGPCTETTPPVLTTCNTNDPNGYAGPANTYSNISPDTMSGEVDFSPAVPANGGTQWFSLEGTPDASSLTLPSSIGIAADTADVTPSAHDGFTVTVANTTGTNIVLTSLVNTLPAGFAYTAGSTTGGITVDPTVASGVLTWTGSFTVPANGTFTFHFGVTVSATPGSYTDTVAGNPGASLNPATASATIQVAVIVPTPAFPLEGLPLAIVFGGAILGLWWRRRTRRAALAPR